MAQIGFSRPEGRVTIQYPDEMSLDDLAETIEVYISVCKLARSSVDSPPRTGQEKSKL